MNKFQLPAKLRALRQVYNIFLKLSEEVEEISVHEVEKEMSIEEALDEQELALVDDESPDDQSEIPNKSE